MTDNKITVVVCSRQTDKEKNDFLEHIKSTCGYNVHVMFLINSEGVSLTKIYNDMLEKLDTEVVIFIHDDIEFLRKGWGAEIARLFKANEEYGIIGVAGSAEFDEKGAWWNYDKKYGQVLHRSNGKSWLSAFSPLLDKDLEETCVIDGLFMAVHTKRISKHFDNDFEGFNHYDTSFCISNYIDGKCKIGVTTNIRMAHNSVGVTKPNWFDKLQKLNEKFSEYYPLNVVKDKKRRNNENFLLLK